MSGDPRRGENRENRDQDRRDSAGESGGHMGAGKSGREDLGSEKPQDDLGSNKPGRGAGGKRAVDDNPDRSNENEKGDRPGSKSGAS